MLKAVTNLSMFKEWICGPYVKKGAITTILCNIVSLLELAKELTQEQTRTRNFSKLQRVAAASLRVGTPHKSLI